MKTAEAMRDAARAVRAAREVMGGSANEPAWRIGRWIRERDRLSDIADHLERVAWEYHEAERKARFVKGH